MTSSGARSIFAGTASLMIVALAGACMSRQAGDVLERDVAQLKDDSRTNQLEFDNKMLALQDVIDRATSVLQRNSADLGADVQGLANDIAEVKGLLSTARRYTDKLREDVTAMEEKNEQRFSDFEARIAALEGRVSGSGGKPAVTLPSDPTALYTEGKTALDGGEFSKARRAFKLLISGYPKHDRAADAQFYRGEAYFKEQRFESAIAEYQLVFTNYPESSIAAQSMFRAGETAERLKFCTEARAYYGALAKKYGKSPYAQKATKRDAIVKKNMKNKSLCSF